MSTTDKDVHRSCYNEWINLQESELVEFLKALTLNSETHDDAELRQLIEKSFKNFEDYVENRTHLAKERVSSYYAPPWCTPLENSSFWIGGCRPSSYVRLTYALCGLEVESQLAEFLNSAGEGNFDELFSWHLAMIDNLHSITVQEEERLTSRTASLQEDMSDHPFVEVATKSEGPCNLNQEAVAAFDQNQQAMASVLEEADRLRLKTVKELVQNILTPVGAAQFLAALNKLLFCMHEWGVMKEEDHHGEGTSKDEDDVALAAGKSPVHL